MSAQPPGGPPETEAPALSQEPAATNTHTQLHPNAIAKFEHRHAVRVSENAADLTAVDHALTATGLAAQCRELAEDGDRDQ